MIFALVCRLKNQNNDSGFDAQWWQKNEEEL